MTNKRTPATHRFREWRTRRFIVPTFPASVLRNSVICSSLGCSSQATMPSIRCRTESFAAIFLLLDHRKHFAAGIVQSRFHGSHRAINHLGDFPECHLFKESQ